MAQPEDPRLDQYRLNIKQLSREIQRQHQRADALRAEIRQLKTAAPQQTMKPAPRPRAGGKRGRAAVVCWDLSHNPAGRAMVLYDLLEADWDVELVGPCWSRFGGKVWPPIAGSGRKVRSFPCDRFEDFYPAAATVAECEHYDLVVVCKPRLPGLLLGAMIQKASAAPLVLDIDDHELSFFSDDSSLTAEEFSDGIDAALSEPYEERATRYCDGLIPEIPARIVSNCALQARYGGLIVRHARDEDQFDPALFDRAAARADMGIADEDFALVFVGTPRPHKGIFDIAETLDALPDKRFVQHFVGDIADKSVTRKLQSYANARIELHPSCSFDALPAKIAAADAVVLLQDVNHRIAQYQIPAKISDASAFGVPIIVSDVPPLRDIAASGLVELCSPDELANSLQALAEERDQGALEARRARIRNQFCSEFGLRVNAARLSLAIEQAHAAPDQPAALAQLLDSAQQSYGNIRQQCRHERGLNWTVPASPRPRPDLVMFWKQNDSELFGRRVDMMAKHLMASGSFERLIHFDAARPMAELSQILDTQHDRVTAANRLTLANIVDDALHLRDGDHALRRTPLWGRRNGHSGLLGDAATSKADIARHVRQTLEALNVDPANAVAWVCPVVFEFPDIARLVPFRAIVTDLIDDQRTIAGQNAQFVERLIASYEATLPLSDLTITNCDPMAEAFAYLNNTIHVVPNGAELPDYPSIQPLPEFETYKQPIIGYVGNLRDRIDWDLLAETARNMPDKSFVMVGGGIRPEALAGIQGIDNLHLHGPIDYAQVARAIRSFDVAIVPHLVSEQTRRMNPLKIYNYAAIRRPIVSTPLDNIDAGLRPFIRAAEDSAAFAQAIDDALTDPLTDQPGFDTALAATSWTSRAERVIDLMRDAGILPTSSADH